HYGPHPPIAPHGMTSSFRQYSLFLAGSILGGVLVTLLLLQVLPGFSSPGARDAARDPRGTSAATAEAGATLRNMALDEGDGGDEALLPPDLVAASYSAAVRRSAPAVVSIYTRRVAAPAGGTEQRLDAPVQERYRDSLGSGVIVDSLGHVVTNQHVIHNSEQIRVQLADGREAPVQVVGSDPDTDLAVLQIELDDLPVMRLGRSDRVAVGDVVLAIGNPLGLSQTVTAGIVSATGRADLGVATFEDFIQTDAAINEGNSGGALDDPAVVRWGRSDRAAVGDVVLAIGNPLAL